MKAKTPFFLAALFATVLTGTAAAAEITLAQCPAPVQETIKSNSQNGKLDEIKTVTVSGRTLYVVEFDLAAGRDLKLHISSDGTLVKSREDIALAQLPEAVRTAAQGMVPAGGKIDDVEMEVASGRTTYHIEIDRPNTNDLKVVFSPDGAVVSQRAD